MGISSVAGSGLSTRGPHGRGDAGFGRGDRGRLDPGTPLDHHRRVKRPSWSSTSTERPRPTPWPRAPTPRRSWRPRSPQRRADSSAPRSTATGQLQLATVEQGSAAILQVGAGSANGALGISAGDAVTRHRRGHHGRRPGEHGDRHRGATGDTSVTLNSGSGGTVTATLAAGGLSTGTVTAQSVSVGNGSLASVVSAINSANAGVTRRGAQRRPRPATPWRSLPNSTGAANDVSIDPNAFAGSGLGTLIDHHRRTGRHRHPGRTRRLPDQLQLQHARRACSRGSASRCRPCPTAPVTVTVSPDGQAAANIVQTLVSAANQVLSTISSGHRVRRDRPTRAGVLNGDYNLEAVAQNILSHVQPGRRHLERGRPPRRPGARPACRSMGAAGRSTSTPRPSPRPTTKTLRGWPPCSPKADRSYRPAVRPPAPRDVSLAFAGDTTDPGSYAVVVNQSATQATDTGTATFASSGAPVGSLGDVHASSSGGLSATYGVAAGESLEEVASGLNSAFASAELLLSAQVVTQGSASSLQITSADYGSSQSLSVTSSGSDELGLVGSFSGSDVEGTIDGVTATGDGQVLNSPVDDPTLAGLSLVVTTPGITVVDGPGHLYLRPRAGRRVWPRWPPRRPASAANCPPPSPACKTPTSR